MKKKQLMLACLLAAGLGSFAQSTPDLPPPPPVEPPKVEIVKFNAPLPLEPTESKAFFEKNPTVANIHIRDNQSVTVTLKNKQKESYDFSNAESKAAFIAKYGEAPSVVPPPPPPKAPRMKKTAPPPPPAPPKVEKVQ